MMHVKIYDDYSVHISDLDLFKQVYSENPNKDTHDFYTFISRDEFLELPDGNYKKVPGIEKMIRITPDEESMNSMRGMYIRSKFDTKSDTFHIWLPNEIRKDLDGEGYQNIETWLLDLIGENMIKGGDKFGREVMNNVINRAKEIEKYNL